MGRCLPPPFPEHSRRHGCGGGPLNNYYGDKCSFYCTPGYRRVNGSTERICQANGTWSGEEIKCEGKRSNVRFFKEMHLVHRGLGL